MTQLVVDEEDVKLGLDVVGGAGRRRHDVHELLGDDACSHSTNVKLSLRHTALWPSGSVAASRWCCTSCLQVMM